MKQNYYYLPILENSPSKDFSNFMNDYTSFIENNHIVTGEFVGVMIEIDNIYNNQIYNYSYLFTNSNKLLSIHL